MAQDPVRRAQRGRAPVPGERSGTSRRSAPVRVPATAAAVLLVLLGTAACGVQSAAPLVRRLERAPVPRGAVLTAEEHKDGSFEQGPKASRDYSLPAPLATACPQLLHGYLDAGYTLTEFSEPPQAPVSDPDAWCATELAAEQAEGTVVAVIVIAYPPGTDAGSRTPLDGVSAVLTAPAPTDQHQRGSHLRLSVG